MPTSYSIGFDRYLTVKDGNRIPVICIEENTSHKSAWFSYKRWANLVAMTDYIDSKLQQAVRGEEIRERLHIGGLWYVSITQNFKCVDIREFYQHRLDDVRPTRTGIALRISEWQRVKNLIEKIHGEHPNIAATECCIYDTSHRHLADALACTGCNPLNTR